MPVTPWRCAVSEAHRSGWRQRLRHSLRWKLVLVFLLLALGMTVTFLGGAQKAFSTGWREAARPLLSDYVDRLAADIGSPPIVARAQALTQRLPLAVRISGPVVNWDSHPGRGVEHWEPADRWDEGRSLLQRTTADGHTLSFSISVNAWDNRPRWAIWFTLGALLLLTAIAYRYVRRLLQPLDDIRAGALRFGGGDFGQPIPVRHAHRPDELGELASTINTMGQDIHQMLEAKRALLLAISHELRSPITRARLHTELLPESPELKAQRDGLLRDLGEMSRLVSDLLESERLVGRHTALQREPTDLVVLAHEVAADFPGVVLHLDSGLPTQDVDPTRLRLLLRNLLDNARRHSADAPHPPELHLRRWGEGGWELTVRDHGPGVPPDQLARLAQPFYRPDAARTRHAGGVGLGLYLCRLVAEAHGGRLVLENAGPGLRVSVRVA